MKCAEARASLKPLTANASFPATDCCEKPQNDTCLGQRFRLQRNTGKVSKLLRNLSKIPFIPGLLLLVHFLLPNFGRFRRIRNIPALLWDVSKRNSKVRSLPTLQRIAPTAICNYRCLFCEIHKDNVLYPKRAKNDIGLSQIKNYEGMVSNAYSLSFFGGSEEPLLSKGFGDIIQYLKRNFGTKLMVNTNATMLKGKLLDTFVDYGFDYIIVSYHAGTEDGYRALMTGKIDKVDENIQALQAAKSKGGQSKPRVAFNFALQRLNADEYTAIFDKAKKFGIDEVIVNRYYGGRNKMQDDKVSFEYDIEEGNRVLDDIYDYAQKTGVTVAPAKVSYWQNPADTITWDPENYDPEIRCDFPWTSIHFNPVLDRANSHYVGVCNRAELFKVDYNRLDLSTPEKALEFWNHPLFRFLRETVNSKDQINPLCKYCKNRSMAALRNVDTDAYAGARDEAVREFFQQYHEKYQHYDLPGLEIMGDNPYSEDRFQDKLSILKAQEIAEKRQVDTAIQVD